MRFPKKPEIDTADITLKIKGHLAEIQKSGVLDNPDIMKAKQEQGYEFTRSLSEVVWDTKILMDKTWLIAPHDQYTPEGKKQVYDIFLKGFRQRPLRLGPTIDSFDDGEIVPSPAYVSDGISDSLDTSLDKVFWYIHSTFSISEQLELFDTILQWYATHFVNPECGVDDCVCESLRKFGDKVKKSIERLSQDLRKQ